MTADIAVAQQDSIVSEPLMNNQAHKVPKKKNFLVRFIDAFDDIDEDYVERIDYNYTAMLQATSNYEYYTIGSSDYAERLSFVQHPDFRVGPYFGWRWLFLGYTLDMTNIAGSSLKRGSKFEFSLYTSMIGVDLIYRRTGTDFYLSRVKGLGSTAAQYEGSDFNDYISTRVLGVNLYYNFNHRRFSNPAVFSQSTIQRRSAGSWQLGLGVTSHSIKFDYTALPNELFTDIVENHYSTLERVEYIDYSIDFGYAYNWVFARNWCLGASFLPALGYKRTSTRTAVVESENKDGKGGFRQKLDELFRQRGDINIDLNGRLGVIYNNGRWFVGAFGVLHNYNYRRADLRFSNTFGTVNICGGIYFQKKKD